MDSPIKTISLPESRYKIKYGHHAEETLMNRVIAAIDSLTDYDTSGRGSLFFPIVASAVLLGCFILHPVTTVQLLFVAMLMIGLTLWSGSQLSNTTLTADHQKIELPFVFLISSGFKLERPWSELRQVYFTRNSQPSPQPDRVCLTFTDGKFAALNLNGFTKEDLERLLLLIQTYCQDVEYYPAIESLSLKLSGSGDGVKGLSFTGLWHEELGLRLGSTAFVPLASNTTLSDGRIKVIGQIAMSGLSAIYLVEAELPDGKRTCVLKEAALPSVCEPEVKEQALEHFAREARILAELDHPRIVKIFDYFVEQDRHYLLMDYLEGHNLRTLVLEQGAQSEGRTLKWAKEMAEIVSYLHNRVPPVMHRDLTPDNFIIEKDGSISLIDFGASNTFIGTVTGTMVGKTAYMPVEQFRGRATLKSDIYALAGTLFFIVTGRDPEAFCQLPSPQLYRAVSVDFADLLLACTIQDDEKSRPSIDEFSQKLKRLVPAK
ncbi:MAG: serine/threonine protein kinase [Candidatus Melainabacteria bacterium]|nr:serine/threonine protein kinase [Candidatus Melainabacteria bacterium]